MIEKFCEYFKGYFNNQKQAFSYPSKFALIELYHEKLDDHKFKIKQKYSISDTPYRESIIKIIENKELKKLIKDIGNTSVIADVIDKCIIDTNAWYVYGCGKPDDDGKFYKVTDEIDREEAERIDMAYAKLKARKPR